LNDDKSPLIDLISCIVCKAIDVFVDDGIVGHAQIEARRSPLGNNQ
jgi:hypothetical protein